MRAAVRPFFSFENGSMECGWVEVDTDAGEYDTIIQLVVSVAIVKVTIISFSYKRGLPKNLGEDGGGFVFDCRSLPNPYWDESLRKFTGCDEPVRMFMVAHAGEVAAFLGPVEELLRNVLEAGAKSGRERLHMAFGCTGGQHRSVYCAEAVADCLRGLSSVEVSVDHTAREYWKT